MLRLLHRVKAQALRFYDQYNSPSVAFNNCIYFSNTLYKFGTKLYGFLKYCVVTNIVSSFGIDVVMNLKLSKPLSLLYLCIVLLYS
jgi:hypothetical protein